jgi:hypothetical protein
MMGRLEREQEQLFYSFRLDEAVPDDHPVRGIAAVLDLSWVHAELAPYYPKIGRPSIDPVLMIRMLVVGYAFAIRSERLLCREVQVNLAYRWFCGLNIEDHIPDHPAFSRGTEDRFGLKPGHLAADTAYGSAETLNWIVNKKKIAPHIPVIDKSKREDGTFSRDDFRFDKDRNIYICPAGKMLHTTGTVHDGNALRYRASKFDCSACAFKM